MATRAAIGFVSGSEIHTIYSHYDGYPEHVGKILQTHYRSMKLAEEIVYGEGHIRNFDTDGTVVRYLRSDDVHEISATPCEAIQGYDYLYLFDNDKQEWVCFGRDYDIPPPALKRFPIPL